MGYQSSFKIWSETVVGTCREWTEEQGEQTDSLPAHRTLGTYTPGRIGIGSPLMSEIHSRNGCGTLPSVWEIY
jgi:hypothetical protein